MNRMGWPTISPSTWRNCSPLLWTPGKSPLLETVTIVYIFFVRRKNVFLAQWTVKRKKNLHTPGRSMLDYRLKTCLFFENTNLKPVIIVKANVIQLFANGAWHQNVLLIKSNQEHHFLTLKQSRWNVPPDPGVLAIKHVVSTNESKTNMRTNKILKISRDFEHNIMPSGVPPVGGKTRKEN